MKKTLTLVFLALLASFLFAATTFYSESMGTVAATTLIPAHETNNGFDNDALTYSGSADIRNTTASTGYTGASGLANVFFTNTVGKNMLVEGINSSSYSNITMSLGHYKNNALGNNELTIEVSSDGTNWTSLTYTHSGAAGWILITPTGTIPSASNLRLRFTQSSSAYQYRIDDIKLAGDTTSPSIGVNPASLTGFYYDYNSGPSGEGSFLLTGTYLTANLNVSSSGTDYEIASSSGGSFGTSLSYSPTGGSVSATVYVQLKAGVAVGFYNLENIVCSSTGATPQNVKCSGEVRPQPPASGIEFDFEGTGEEKTSYGTGTVTLSGYDCDLTGALIGTDAVGDIKFEARSARLRYDGTTYGSLTMLDLKSNGIGTISFYYSRSNFSGDITGTAPKFVVEYTSDAKAWVQAGSEVDLTGIDTFALFSTTVNQTGDLRIRIRQTAGDSGKRWNVDNIQITDYGFVPVELTSFTAVLTSDLYVSLHWTTQSESGLAGYYIYRGTNGTLAEAERINALIAPTNTSSEANYEFTDTDVVSGNTYYYWLQNMDLNGSSGFHGPISVVVNGGGSITPPAIITRTELLNAYPNPFTPNTTLRYMLKEKGQVRIDIYNIRGQVIRSFVTDHATKGYYQIHWDGTDLNGNAVSSGVYYSRMTCGSYTGSEKLVLIK
jgi:hypothetical protein